MFKPEINRLGVTAMVIRCIDQAHVRVIVDEAELEGLKVRPGHSETDVPADKTIDSDISYSRRSSQAPRTSSRQSYSYDSTPDWQEIDSRHSNMQSRSRSRSNTSPATLRQPPPPVDDYDMFDKDGLRIRVGEI